MPILVVCPNCSAKLNAPESATGKKVKCPKCQTTMLVPTPEPEEAAFEVVEEPPPAKTASKTKAKADTQEDEEEQDEKPRHKKAKAETEEDEKPRKKRWSERDEEEDEDRPKKKRKKQAETGVSMTRNVIMGVVLVILLGVVGYVFYDKYGKKDDTAKDTPSSDRPSGGPNPSTPGGSGGNNIDNSRFARVQRLLDEMFEKLLKRTTDAMNQISDKESALSAAKVLQESAVRARNISDELKEIGKLTLAEANQGRPPNRANADAHMAATNKVGRLLAGDTLPPKAKEALTAGLTDWGEANLKFQAALLSILPPREKK